MKSTGKERLAVPVLVMVTIKMALDVPIGTEPKSSAVGESVAMGAAVVVVVVVVVVVAVV